jgi:membrane protease YdiL (CAAX protease family)
MPLWLLIALGIVFVTGLGVYARLFTKFRAGACHAPTTGYTPLDLGVVLGLTALLINGIVSTLSSPDRSIGPEQLVDGLIVYAVGVLLILALLVFRRIPVRAQFGFGRLKTSRALATGLALIVAAFPVVAVVTVVVQSLMGDSAHSQEIVDYFRRSLNDSDTNSQFVVVILASFAAPFAEEFIFRGYFYGVLKRFAGPIPALLATSALFSAVHANLAAAAPLFILAVALNIAYEVTGSLLVPMTMHAVFNTTQLILISLIAHNTP